MHLFKKQHVLIFLALSALCINGCIEGNNHLKFLRLATGLIGLDIHNR